MKCLLLFISLVISVCSFSQSDSTSFYIKPVIGINLQSDQLEELAIAKPIKILTSSVIGLEVGHNKFPLKLRYQYLIYGRFKVNHDRDLLGNYDLRNVWESNEIGIFYDINKLTIGLTHYWKKKENSVAHNLIGLYIRKGFNISVSYPIEWIDIELRTQVQYHSGFAAIFGSANYSLSLLYRFEKQKKQKYKSNFLHLNAVTGIRFFPLNFELRGNELLIKPVGIAPQLGLEFLFDKYNVSLNLEKDWWLSFNGGSNIRDIKGLIYNTFVGLKYHQQLKNARHIRYGFGGSWTEDGEYQFPNIPPKHLDKDGKLLGLSNYQVKGFAISISYEILPNTDLELKTMLPVAGEYAFDNITRTSIGIIHRYNPFKK